MIQSFQVTTIAGNGQEGFQDGNAEDARLHCPTGLCISKDGILYFADSKNHSIRMVYDDRVTTIAGNRRKGFQDGNALEAMFSDPFGVCISNEGALYVTDRSNYRIRMIDNSHVSTLAGNGDEGYQDGNAQDAMFSGLGPICISKDGRIYVSESRNYRIRMIYKNQVTTIAGNGNRGVQDGNALEATFTSPAGICISNDGRLYVSETETHVIRMIHDGQVITIAGNGNKGCKDGKALTATFSSPMGVSISKDGKLYISDCEKCRIRMISDDKVSTIAGNGKRGFQDGNAQGAMFSVPVGICSKEDKVYISDYDNNRIRMISRTGLQKSPFGFSLLLDMRDNILCDSQISFNNIIYHLHSTLVNVRCPLLFDKSYYTLVEQSNISNKSFESFLTFLYSNKLTKQQNQIWPTKITVRNIVELIFVFDVMMNCKWIVKHLNTKLRKQLADIFKTEQQECAKELIVDILPHVYHLQQIIRTRPIGSNIMATSNTSYTEDCYDLIIDELKKRRPIFAHHLHGLQANFRSVQAFIDLMRRFMSGASVIQTLDEPTTICGAEPIELSKLAFAKTNISRTEDYNKIKTQIQLQSSLSSEDLDKWTTPDFVIKLCNDDDISYHVHKLILCGRWKYFSQMARLGMNGSNNNEMMLSGDWSRSIFEKFMKYIYLNEIDFDELKDVKWLMNNGDSYEIIVDSKRKNGIEQKGAYGFEELYEHCNRVVQERKKKRSAEPLVDEIRPAKRHKSEEMEIEE